VISGITFQELGLENLDFASWTRMSKSREKFASEGAQREHQIAGDFQGPKVSF
jgi:hypothetical protein